MVIQSAAWHRLRADALPRALRLGGDRAVEQVVGQPVQLEDLAAEQRVGDVEDGGRPIVTSGGAEPAAHGGEQRLAHAEQGADARGDAALALEVLGVREARQARTDGRRRTPTGR